MKAIYFQGANVKYGEEQPDYIPLPAYQGNGVVTCCFQLTPKELKAISRTPIIHIKRMTFGHPPQPMNVRTNRPRLPMDHKMNLIVTPKQWEDNTAIFELSLVPVAKAELLKHGHLWITTVTYGTALQPVKGEILPPFESTIIMPGNIGKA